MSDALGFSPFSGSNVKEPKMPKRSGKPRLHKRSGRAFIELGGKRIYLEVAYGAKEVEKEYDQFVVRCSINYGTTIKVAAPKVIVLSSQQQYPSPLEPFAEQYKNAGRQFERFRPPMLYVPYFECE